VCRLRRRWRDGASAIVFEPREKVARLAAQAPPPRAHQVGYHGILAPSARWRAYVVPRGEAGQTPTVAAARSVAPGEWTGAICRDGWSRWTRWDAIDAAGSCGGSRRCRRRHPWARVSSRPLSCSERHRRSTAHKNLQLRDLNHFAAPGYDPERLLSVRRVADVGPGFLRKVREQRLANLDLARAWTVRGKDGGFSRSGRPPRMT
jgi:hypothetical protein